MSANVGLLDLPLSSTRPFLQLLQEKGKLGVTQAFNRDYVLYTTFQMELHAYQTTASDRAQRLSGIEGAIQAIDGLNFMKTLTQLCLINYGKINSLSYRGQVENYELESEFVAMRLIQAAVGAWVALRAQEKWGSTHPVHPLWRRKTEAYRIGVIAMRDQRLRCKYACNLPPAIVCPIDRWFHYLTGRVC
jgi:hypothetical protein